ncbi:MAG: hypothetical protein GY866_34925 [Proteobacteria bacterium]|nr:hypothetical protein [Pseudomonadota bacterium]
MGIKAKKDNEWKPATFVHVKKDGEWKLVKKAYVKKDDEWKETFGIGFGADYGSRFGND